MRSNTVLTTIALGIVCSLIAFVLFFPREVELMTGSLRRIVDSTHADFVRLEYIAADPQISRGWRTLRVVKTREECLPLLGLDHSRDRNISGPIGSLRCTSYLNSGEQVQVIATRSLATR